MGNRLVEPRNRVHESQPGLQKLLRKARLGAPRGTAHAAQHLDRMREEIERPLRDEIAQLRDQCALTLTGHQILTLAERVGDEDCNDVELNVAHEPGCVDAETGEPMPAGIYWSYADYPEEGRAYLPPEPAPPALRDEAAV